jgi:uncharacterized protein
MSLYAFHLEIRKLLGNMETWLDKATAHATVKKYDPNVLLQSRLAPDMFPLVRQFQSVCDQAKYAAGRATGKDIPAHPDTEQTFDELRKRISAVLSYLDGFTARDYEGSDDRTVSLPRWEGKSLTGTVYFVEHALPNFFFHLTTVYAILRHNGIEIGKRDFLGALSYR